MSITLVARHCERCGAELPADARRDKRFCSSTCRARARRRRLRAAEPLPTPPSAPEVELEIALERALAEPRLVALIANAARTNWRASAWLLERRHPERWAIGARPEAIRTPADDAFVEVDEIRERRERRRVERRSER
jgi:predicted nucleic acid-binding Zn ribbon protein